MESVVRVLVAGMTNKEGPQERLIIERCEGMDKGRVQFDFLSQFPECAFADRIKALGGTIHTVQDGTLDAFFGTHGHAYDVLWDHEPVRNATATLASAKRAGIPCRIYHGYATDNARVGRGVVKKLGRCATALWADTVEAAQALSAKRSLRCEVVRDGTDAHGDMAARLLQTARAQTRGADPRYLLSAMSNDTFAHAMTKARQDIETFAMAQGFQRISMTAADSTQGSILAKLRMLVSCTLDWIGFSRFATPGAIVLMQYPYFPLKSAPMTIAGLSFLKKRKGCRFVALVHDLDSLRGEGGKPAIYSDSALLPRFSYIICHNETMMGYLEGKGIARDRMISLGIFDYVTDAHFRERAFEASVCVAGNLSPWKVAFLYELLKTPDLPYRLHLYGPSFEGEQSERVLWHGALPADELPGKLEGAFGLIWDGDSVDGAEGFFGEYTRYNNPHKLSLYVASGMPVIIGNHSARADFVREHNIGLTVDSLHDLPAALQGVTAEAYAAMRENALAIGKQAREGHFFREAVEEAFRRIDQSTAGRR